MPCSRSDVFSWPCTYAHAQTEFSNYANSPPFDAQKKRIDLLQRFRKSYLSKSHFQGTSFIETSNEK